MKIAITCILGIAYLVVIRRDWRNAIGASALIMPFNQYLPGLGVPLINLHTLLIVGMAFAMALRSSEQRSSGRRSRRNKDPQAPIWLGLFAFMLTAAAIHGALREIPREYAHLYDAQHVLLGTLKEKLSVVFFCYAAFRLTDNETIVRRGLIGALISVSVETFFGAVEMALHPGQVTGHLAARGPMGTFLATYATMAAGIFLSGARIPYRWQLLGVALIGAVVATGTRSRGAVLAVGTSLLLVALWKSRLLFVVLVVAAVNYQSWMPERLLERFDSATTTSDVSDDVEIAGTAADRIQIWKAGFRTIPDYPFGIGMGTYHVTVADYGLVGFVRHPNKNAHNEFVLHFVELGILGGVILIALLVSMVRAGWIVYRRDPDPFSKAMGFGALSAIVAASAANMVVSLMFTSIVSGILWLVLGMTARRAADLRSGRVSSATGDAAA